MWKESRNIKLFVFNSYQLNFSETYDVVVLLGGEVTTIRQGVVINISRRYITVAAVTVTEIIIVDNRSSKNL